jgi:CubicO group peptidase (beta-lactamase class C family)
MSSDRRPLRRRLRIVVAALLPLGAISSNRPPPAAPDPASAVADVQAWIDREFKSTGAASLTMAVAQNGRILWARSWGWADKEQRVPATPQTPYLLASVSKSVTATALMTLVERGAVDLDAPIDTWLGGPTLRPYGGPSRGATVRRVLSHTAGLPSFQDFYVADEMRHMPSLAETIRRYGILVHAPGERFIYSNFGYGLLGHVMTTVSGQSLPAFMEAAVFAPLGMTHSALGAPPSTARPAVPYAVDGTRLPAYEHSIMAASSVFASAEDLLRFGALHVKATAGGGRKILGDASIDAMQRRVAPSPFGMGWFVFDGAASGVVFHGGGMDGVSAVLFLVPSRRLVVVGLCSTMIDLPGRAAAEIIQRLAPGVRIEPPIPPTVPPEPIPSSLVGEWSGELLAHNGPHRFQLTIEAGGQITGQLDRLPRSSILSPEWVERELRGTILADIGLNDLRQPYRLRFGLSARHADRLEGQVSAWTFRAGRGPDILPSYARLHRVAPPPARPQG